MNLLLLDIEEEFYPVARSPEFYLISKSGRVVSLKPGSIRYGKLLSIWPNPDGYLGTKIENKHCSIHRLLAETFIPNPENKAQVNHKDGNKLNNSLDNLEWVTQQENLYHSCTTGLHVNQLCPIVGTHLTTKEKISFNSQSEAHKAGFQQRNISACIRGLRKSAGGYSWSRA